MSHEATLWAHRQRQLSAPQWRILVVLADRHNPDFGCFPRQEQIATDCNMSRSQVNVHLAALEEMGLIHRLRRFDPETKKKMSTRYILGFEADFPQGQKKPCLETRTWKNEGSHVRFNSEALSGFPDIEPVREPVITTYAREEATDEPPSAASICLDACGPGVSDHSREAIRETSAIVDEWIAAGFDLDLDVLPVLRQMTARPEGRVIRTFAYFTPRIGERHAKRLRGLGPGSAEKLVSAGGGGAPPPKSIADVAEVALARLADWINSERYVPPSAVTNTQRDALLARGLVTEERLRARQIY